MKKLNILGSATLLCAMALGGAGQAFGADPVFYGYQGDMEGYIPRGLFSFNPFGSELDMLWEDQLAYNEDGTISTVNMLGGWIREGRLCGFESYYPIPSLDYFHYVERDLLTGEIIVDRQVDTKNNNWSNFFLFATYCPVDDRVYGFGFNANRTGFVFKSAPSTDLDQATIIKRCQGNEFCKSVAFNTEQGILVGMNAKCELVEIDVNTGNQTTIFTPTLNPAPDYDIASGLIWIPSRQAYGWNFYTVNADVPVSNFKLLDPVKQTVTDLRSFPRGYNFNYFVAENNVPEASANAPEACTGLAAHFSGVDTKGNFTFTLPSKLVNGGAISGNVKYTLYVDNKAMLDGEGAPGANITTSEVELTSGSHYVRVLPQSGDESGLGELIAVFIGEDIPMAPVNVTLTETTLSWDPVTRGLHGGALEGVEYDVYFGTRLIDQTSATSIDVTDLIDPNDPLAAYQAEVRARCGSKVSKGGVSNKIVAGQSLTVPFTIEPTAQQFATSIEEDADGNNTGWSFDTRSYDNQSVITSGFAKGESEDWLFLPRFKAETEKIYNFTFNVNVADVDFTGGSVEVWLGDAASSKAMKVNVMPALRVFDYSPIRLSASFMIPEEIKDAEAYYLGLCVKSENGVFSPLQFETLKVGVTSTNMDAPEAVSNLKAETVKDRPICTVVSFVMPDRTLAGDPIAATQTISAVVASSNGFSKTVTGAPGEAVSLELELTQGDFLITVTPSKGDAQGMPANVVARLGFGLPGAVRNLRAEYDEANTFLTLRWDAPLTDMDGTPCDGDYLSYNVYTYDAAEGAYVLSVTVPYPLTFATVSMTGLTTLTNLEVCVVAVNATGISPLLSRMLCQLGTPYTLPISDDLNGDNFAYEPMTIYMSDGYEGAQLVWGAPSRLDLPSAMVTGDVGDVIAGIPNVKGAKSRLVFPKFSTIGYDDVDCNFILWTGDNAADISVGATAYPMDHERIISTVEKGSGYTTVRVPLSKDMCDNPWVSVSINATYPSVATRFVLAGYSFEKGLGVDGVSDTIYGSILGGDKCVVVCGYEGMTAEVYTLDGRKVAAQTLSGADFISLQPGIYVVKVGARTAKVVVR